MTEQRGTAGFGGDRTLGELVDEDTIGSAAVHVEPRRERPVTIQRNLLVRIKELQRKLDVYVRAYISLQEQAVNHERADALLSRARAEQSLLSNDLYQQQLSEKVKSLRMLKDELGELLEIADQPLIEGIERHDGVLDAARRAMAILRRPGQDAAAIEAVGDVFTSIEDMGYGLNGLRDRCEDDARRLLGDLGGVIGTIFELDLQKQEAARKRTSSVQRSARAPDDTSARRTSPRTAGGPTPERLSQDPGVTGGGTDGVG